MTDLNLDLEDINLITNYIGARKQMCWYCQKKLMTLRSSEG